MITTVNIQNCEEPASVESLVYKCIMFNATIIVVRQPSDYMVLAFHWQYMAVFHIRVVFT